MTQRDWDELQSAYIYLTTTSMSRIDTDKWSVYKVGLNIRIDIKGPKI